MWKTCCNVYIAHVAQTSLLLLHFHSFPCPRNSHDIKGQLHLAGNIAQPAIESHDEGLHIEGGISSHARAEQQQRKPIGCARNAAEHGLGAVVAIKPQHGPQSLQKLVPATMVQKEYAQLEDTNGLCAAGTKGFESGYQICEV